MDKATFAIAPVVGFKIDSPLSGRLPELLSVSSSSKISVIRTDTPLPIIAEWPYNSVYEILDTKKLTEVPTAHDVSGNSALLALGYQSGAICIIDVERKAVLKQIKRRDRKAVLSIQFSSDSQSFTAVFADGGITSFVCGSSLGIFSVKEKSMRTAEKIEAAFMWDPSFDWLVAGGQDSVYMMHINNEECMSSVVIYQTESLHSPLFFCNQCKEALMLAIACGKEFQVYTVNNYGVYKSVSKSSFETEIINVVYLGNRVYVLVMADNSLQIIKASGNAGDHCSSDLLSAAIKNSKIIFSAHQKLFLMNEASCLQLSFLDWGTHLQQLAKSLKWEECFDIASDIYTGNNLEFFGIPSSVKKRCLQVKQAMQYIFDSILKKGIETKNVFSKIMETAGMLEMSTFISKTMLKYAQENDYLEEYFDKLFQLNSDLSRYCTDEAIDALFTFPAHEVNNFLIHSSVVARFPAKIIEYAMKNKLDDLLMEIWLKIYGDYLSPCIYLADSPDLYVFINQVFFENSSTYTQKVVVTLWLFTILDNKFPRLYKMMISTNLSTNIIQEIFSLCPITMRDGTILDQKMAVDALLRSSYDFYQETRREEIAIKYPQIFKILGIVAEVILNENLEIHARYLKFLMYWIFNDKEKIDTREHLLQLINCTYPHIVVLSDLLLECESAGFTDIITSFYMADKSYDLVIPVLTSIPERRNKIFPFIYEHINETVEIRKAIQSNFQTLILIDTEKAIKLVQTSWPELHRIFLDTQSRPYVKYIYMKFLYENPELQLTFTDADTFEYFKLICQFSPDEALPMLKATHTIMFDEALPVCIRNRVVDACVHIHTMLGDNESAVKMISEELQQELVEIIHSNKKVRVTSIDRVRDDPSLIKPYNTIYLAFDLLDKTPELGVMLDEMWRDIFKAFQLPMYLCGKLLDQKTKQSFILFFAFFIVEVIPKTSGDFVMTTLNRDFKIMQQQQIKAVLHAVFMHFDYQKMLSGTVRSLLLEDCKTLRSEAALITTRAANLWSTRCGICNQFITGQGGVGMLAFQCGHCFHNNRICGMHKCCPVCKGAASQRQNNEIRLSNRAKMNRARAMQRVDFGLRHNYGDDQDENIMGNYIYFLRDSTFVSNEKFPFNLAKTVPPANPVFLEI